MKRSLTIRDTVTAKVTMDLSDEETKAIRDQVNASKEDETKKTSLLVRIAATHAGMVNKNLSMYIPEKMRDSAGTWIDPHEKPVLLHHDKHADPIGRVKNAEYIDLPLTDSADAPKGYISVLAKITDSAAIEKILDERYLTVSIGGSTNDVNCSICDKNITDGICEHKKGKVYDGKKCHWKIGSMTYNELSFVNTPADEHAKVEAVEMTDAVITMDDEQNIETDATSESTDSDKEEISEMTKIIGDYQNLENYAAGDIYSEESRAIVAKFLKDRDPESLGAVFDLWFADNERFTDWFTSASKERDAEIAKVQALSDEVSKKTVENSEIQDEVTKLRNQTAQLRAEKQRLLENNASLLKDKRLSLAKKLVDMRIVLRKPDMRDVFSVSNNEERTTLLEDKVVEFAQRDTKSLEDAIKDLAVEVNDVRAPSGFVESEGLSKEDRLNSNEESETKPRTQTRKERVVRSLGIVSQKGTPQGG